MRKYRFVTEFESSFPDIRKGFQKFEHIVKEDEVLKKYFLNELDIFKSVKKEALRRLRSDLLNPKFGSQKSVLL